MNNSDIPVNQILKSNVWYEKYKPQKVEDVILPEILHKKIKSYMASSNNLKSMPHLGLFSKFPGTGKSSLGNAIVTQAHTLYDIECLWINASLERGIDTLRGKLQRFVQQQSFSVAIKIVVCDEFDNFSKEGMAAFRGFIDEYSENVRFIFTGNYKEKIIEPLLDRLEIYDFNTFEKSEMIKPIFMRLTHILENEGIEYKKEDVVNVIKTNYPKIRSMIGDLRKGSLDNVLTIEHTDSSTSFSNILENILSKNFQGAIDNVVKLNGADDFYTFLFDNLASFPEDKRTTVIITIAKYQFQHAQVRDKLLNAGACSSELMHVL